jgi:hypothetical protein
LQCSNGIEGKKNFWVGCCLLDCLHLLCYCNLIREPVSLPRVLYVDRGAFPTLYITLYDFIFRYTIEKVFYISSYMTKSVAHESSDAPTTRRLRCLRKTEATGRLDTFNMIKTSCSPRPSGPGPAPIGSAMCIS